ncbi:MAG TPA: hypothetical protein VM032_19370 [Vicinamibacterales bacterium]|nr:hypothetical protein [Vicinamibacterales bacterium]
MHGSAAAALVLAATALGTASLLAQARPDAFGAPLTHPAIQYADRQPHDRIARLNADLERGAIQLPFDPANGYLRALLTATGLSPTSQVLVFSETSAQAEHINMRNPRAIFFDDDLAIGWVRGATALEVAAHDPEQGVIFYTLEQKPSSSPRFTRDNGCLLCHDIWETHGVPGFQVLSTFPMEDARAYANGLVTDHRTPFPERWGGWFVTGRAVPAHHYGNLPVVRPLSSRSTPRAPALPSVTDQFDLTGYPSDTSDVVALMVLEHQSRIANMITWLGWEARVAAADIGRMRPQAGGGNGDRVQYVARQLVDYMLFLDEAPLSEPVEGSAGFAGQFAARGPKDSAGRSLRAFDLRTRLFRYPCSYMIDSAAFATLPSAAKQAVYSRLWDVLSGADASPEYKRLSLADRRAVAGILKETHADLASGFGSVVR